MPRKVLYKVQPVSEEDVDTSVHGRTVMLMDAEYELAKEIMSIVRMHLTAHPDIDTCKVSRLCEMMLVYV